MGRGMQFMAVREDMLAVLARIERLVPLTYRLCFAPTPDPPTWNAAAAIDDLGVAVEGGTNNQKRYLVMPTASTFTPYLQTLPNGETLGRVYPEGNPDSVVLTPAGLYSDWCIVIGDAQATRATITSTRMPTARPTQSQIDMPFTSGEDFLPSV